MSVVWAWSSQGGAARFQFRTDTRGSGFAAVSGWGRIECVGLGMLHGTPQFPIFTILQVLLAPFRETWTIFCGNDLNQRPIGAPGNRFTFHWKTAICMRASFCLYSLNMLNSHFHLHCEDDRLRINILAWFEYSMQLNSDNCTNRWASSL